VNVAAGTKSKIHSNAHPTPGREGGQASHDCCHGCNGTRPAFSQVKRPQPLRGKINIVKSQIDTIATRLTILM